MCSCRRGVAAVREQVGSVVARGFSDAYGETQPGKCGVTKAFKNARGDPCDR